MLLVDAYNVLHHPDAGDLDVAGLCALIGASRHAGARIVVVCDGTGARGPDFGTARDRARLSGAEVVFVGPSRSADDEIEARLRRSGGAGVTVVSDDRRLKRAASRARARIIGSGQFLAHLLLDRDRRRPSPIPGFARDIPLDRYSVAHWMHEFGLTPGALLDRRSEARRDPAGRSPPGLGPAAAKAANAGRASPEERGPEPGSLSDAPPPGPTIPEGAPGPASPNGTSAAREESLLNDPILREALEASRGRLRIEDLDMDRWLDRPGRPG